MFDHSLETVLRFSALLSEDEVVEVVALHGSPDVPGYELLHSKHPAVAKAATKLFKDKQAGGMSATAAQKSVERALNPPSKTAQKGTPSAGRTAAYKAAGMHPDGSMILDNSMSKATPKVSSWTTAADSASEKAANTGSAPDHRIAQSAHNFAKAASKGQGNSTQAQYHADRADEHSRIATRREKINAAKELEAKKAAVKPGGMPIGGRSLSEMQRHQIGKNRAKAAADEKAAPPKFGEAEMAKAPVGNATVHPGQNKGNDGFHILGQDKKGRVVKAFTGDRAQADAMKANVIAGHDVMYKLPPLPLPPSDTAGRSARDSQKAENASESASTPFKHDEAAEAHRRAARTARQAGLEDKAAHHDSEQKRHASLGQLASFKAGTSSPASHAGAPVVKGQSMGDRAMIATKKAETSGTAHDHRVAEQAHLDAKKVATTVVFSNHHAKRARGHAAAAQKLGG